MRALTHTTHTPAPCVEGNDPGSILSVSLRVKGAISLQRFHPFSLLTSHFCDPDTPVKVQVSHRPPQSGKVQQPCRFTFTHTGMYMCSLCTFSKYILSVSLSVSLSPELLSTAISWTPSPLCPSGSQRAPPAFLILNAS